MCPRDSRGECLQHKMTEVHVTSHTRVAHHPYRLPNDHEYTIWEHLYPAAVVGHVTSKAMQVNSLLMMGALFDNC